MTLQCVHCPGRTDHSTADCPTFNSGMPRRIDEAIAKIERRLGLPPSKRAEKKP